MDKAWVCIVEMTTGPKYGLMAVEGSNKIWAVRGFESLRDGLNYFEEGYKSCHLRGGTWSASASINYIFFRPSFVQMALSELESFIEKRTVCRARNVAGIMDYIPLTPKAKSLWEAGTKPALIKEEWFDGQAE